MKTVLVVDDSPLLLETISLLLGEGGFNVVLTQEPHRAIGLCKEIDFDVILCDLFMGQESQELGQSVSSGMDLIWKILDTHPKIPVIAMSGIVDEDALEKMRRHGVAGAIQKPFGRDTLVEKIDSAIQDKRSEHAKL